MENVIEKGKHIVQDTEELTYVKNVASELSNTTKNATLKVFDQLAGGVKATTLLLFADVRFIDNN
jgi:hypothetical protein